MLNALGRKCLVTLGLCASLLASASAYGLGGSTEGGVIIVAPCSVWAGNPIPGYLTGGAVPMVGAGYGKYGNLPGSPVYGCTDPTYFLFQTFEPMAGSVVTIIASDGSGKSDTAIVMVQ